MHTKDADSPRSILIVDDNPDIYRDFRTILDTHHQGDDLFRLKSEIIEDEEATDRFRPNYQLTFSNHGREAVDKVKASIDKDQPFQLAFVDFYMPPGWDGQKTIERIWKVDPRIQIVLCTAFSIFSQDQIEKRFQHNENLLILKKPFDVAEVTQMANTLTQKWLLAKQTKQKQEELAFITNQRTQDLQAANHRMKSEIEEHRQLSKRLNRAQKMEAIGTLAAGVAHDLNNLLSGIVSYPDLLIQLVEPEHPIIPKLQLIQESGRKASAIVQDMLTLGRRAVRKHEAVDLHKVVDEYVQSPEWTKTQFHHPNIRMEIRSAANLSHVVGSEIQIIKSLMNLVSNAAEAIPDDGTITISLSERHLNENYDGYESIPAGHYIVLGVADTGEGISENDLEHIFEPFYTKKKMKRSGAGLGLAVVWGTVRDHYGYLDVQSQSGTGSLFELYFPDNGDNNKSSPDESATPEKGRDAHILVVDDVIEQRQIAKEMLNALGYTAETVSSGEEALEYLEARSVDLLLLDMTMDPGIDGLETYQRALQLCPTQRAIIASGFTKNERVNKALELGASAFLHKPYRLKDLVDAVKAALSK
jgi:signal transduction histidine kinase/ActR/RegA family two-component response regulator